MYLDVKNLRDFYAGQLGRTVRRVLNQRLRSHWHNVEGMTVVGLGFASPFLRVFRDEAEVTSALMPAEQGALVWPSQGPIKSVLVDEHCLPLSDSSVDRILLVHCLEVTDGVRPLLREVWRVLKPEGRLILVVPNRRSIWARIDTTPFGHGRPYSRGQIRSLVEQAMFTPIGWSSALHVPPWERRFLLRGAMAWERIGTKLMPGFSGVLIVEAQKELMAPISGGLPVPAKAKLATAQGDAAGRTSVRRLDPAACPEPSRRRSKAHLG